MADGFPNQLAGLGHNNGPAMDVGVSYRKHVWRRARKDLLPVLPLPVVRQRVRRAAEIGLDYTTYATVRATTGRDVVALLFSSNALRLFQEHKVLDADRRAKLEAMQRCDRRAILVAPLRVGDIDDPVFEGIYPAPHIHASWPEAAQSIAAAHSGQRAASVVLIGDTSVERDWSMAGRLAGYVPADRFF